MSLNVYKKCKAKVKSHCLSCIYECVNVSMEIKIISLSLSLSLHYMTKTYVCYKTNKTC